MHPCRMRSHDLSLPLRGDGGGVHNDNYSTMIMYWLIINSSFRAQCERGTKLLCCCWFWLRAKLESNLFCAIALRILYVHCTYVPGTKLSLSRDISPFYVVGRRTIYCMYGFADAVAGWKRFTYHSLSRTHTFFLPDECGGNCWLLHIYWM